MDSKGRRLSIAERLRVNGEVLIADLAVAFGTSEMTIRRDLELLESRGEAPSRARGAISVRSRSFEPPILQRSGHMAEAKRRIGVAAASLVRENETVILDVGTTTLEMARAMSSNLAATVITSSLVIAAELSAKASVKTIVTGGVVRHGEMSLIGPRAQSSFDDLNCDAVFLGVAGVSDVKGITEYNLDDAVVKRAAVAASRRVIVLADATKIGQIAFVSVAALSAVHLLITTAPADDVVIRRIKDQGVEVLHVELNDKEPF